MGLSTLAAFLSILLWRFCEIRIKKRRGKLTSERLDLDVAFLSLEAPITSIVLGPDGSKLSFCCFPPPRFTIFFTGSLISSSSYIVGTMPYMTQRRENMSCLQATTFSWSRVAGSKHAVYCSQSHFFHWNGPGNSGHLFVYVWRLEWPFAMNSRS